jgi:UPF0755 protein
VRSWSVAIALSLLLLAGASGLWLQQELATPYFGGSTECFVDIPRGAGTSSIAEALTTAGVLHHELPFVLYVRWTGIGRRLQAGEYRFTNPARPSQIARRLVQGDVFFHAITIPEGLTAKETIRLIARSGLGDERELEELLSRTDWISDLDSRATSLEGYLFPDTYRFSRHATSADVLKAMVGEFRLRISMLLATSPLPSGWNVSQILTLASLVEEEAKTTEERRLIASVLVNRLRRRMPLDCDPTIIYALKQMGAYDGNLRKADMARSSPYNTYIHTGLPPGPIANPGADSLLAALTPAKSDYLYYVSRNDGTHHFSKDLRSHLIAVARYQKHRVRTGPQ